MFSKFLRFSFVNFLRDARNKFTTVRVSRFARSSPVIQESAPVHCVGPSLGVPGVVCQQACVLCHGLVWPCVGAEPGRLYAHAGLGVLEGGEDHACLAGVGLDAKQVVVVSGQSRTSPADDAPRDI